MSLCKFDFIPRTFSTSLGCSGGPGLLDNVPATSGSEIRLKASVTDANSSVIFSLLRTPFRFYMTAHGTPKSMSPCLHYVWVTCVTPNGYLSFPKARNPS
jgi:hypothetical protein